MNRYIKLVNFEISRFIKLYFVLIAITVISQVTGTIMISSQYVNSASEAIYQHGVSIEQFITERGLMSMFQVTASLWFLGPIALCIAALIFYTFFIWYRDWFAKNTFIYRLLMLPTARINIYLAKATSIFLLVLGLVALQLFLIPLLSTILKWIVPVDLRLDMSVTELIDSFFYLQIILPQSFVEFLIYYGIGFMVVFIVFTAILFERSFRLKGILLGGVYGILSIAIFTMPFFIFIDYLYPIELLAVETVLGLIVAAMSIWVSHYLLTKKVMV
ncbi:hypothetical protein [Virgibacillus sp. YIM 98842]|uniref:hypothetical protein n=1 Tax=Virgibacillus sp. YIM 98842 TaxID=2663533 RepID=UPI0013DA9ACD|nr:hypothetical protein [Virgibacillus sp. YIM 98842]